MKILKHRMTDVPFTACSKEEHKPRNTGPLLSKPKKRDTERSIICMEDVKDIQSGELEVEEGTIFTPLAKDYLKEKGIRIVFR